MVQSLRQPGTAALTRDGGAGEPVTVVGVGASAGGLKALERFLRAVPVDSGMAYVVIMHLDAERESRIAEILQDRAAIPAMQVNGSTAIEANRIYVIPPEHDLTIEGGDIRVRPRGDGPLHLPVDLLFRTLAESRGARAIGVVLSGTGEDGSSGIRSIKECGGITLAQTPAEADYDGMPRSAIATGQIDLVLKAGEMVPQLLRMRGVPSAVERDGPSGHTEALLAEVFATLRGKTGHDFSLYRRSTLLRRLDRRLAFNDVATLEDYLPALRAGNAEARALVRDLLISVSGFFRDPAAFAALEKLIPSLFEGKAPEDAVRVWVAGCATGEEAYSIAILLAEHADTLERPPRVQIFATDMNENGYATGREAFYSSGAVADIPPTRLRRFFHQEAGGFRVKKSLREGILFAVHNVLRDPPFSRLDLVSCRNLLIYLQPEAQARAVESFHYSLRPGGALFLGASETAGDSGLFLPIDGPNRIYRRNVTVAGAGPRLSAADLRSPPPPAGVPEALDGESRSSSALHLRMLEAYGPPSIVVDEALQVVHLSGGAGRYLHFGTGEPSHNLIDLTRGELRTELRAALYQAFEKGEPTRCSVDPGNDAAPVSIRVYPPIRQASPGRLSLVVFEQEPAPRAATAGEVESAPDAAAEISRLEAELGRAREQLESISAVRDRTVQELQAVNAELRSISEEQKAAMEELETSREEVQSINEELTTINQEHQNTIEELKRTNTDLQNLVEASEIGTIFVDRAMRIRRFTPSVVALFNFAAADQGRPLGDITHRLDYATLVTDAEGVLSSRDRIEREVSSDGGEWFIVRISPYRSAEGAAEGAVITFFNITAQKRVQAELREATLAAEAANLAKDTFLATLSHEFRTPLTGILGYADILDLGSSLTAEQQQRVGRIKAGVWHLDSMIDEILTFTRLDQGRALVQPERMDARELAREAGALVEPAAEARGLAFVLDLPEEAIELDTDRGKARQILINLGGNAVKYTDRGEIRLRVRQEDGRVVFEVRDTGIGISEKNHVRIFERFWQVESASTRSHGGMGIGLAAARELSRLLGGDVRVESELGRGSTFRVWLPAKPVGERRRVADGGSIIPGDVHV